MVGGSWGACIGSQGSEPLWGSNGAALAVKGHTPQSFKLIPTPTHPPPCIPLLTFRSIIFCFCFFSLKLVISLLPCATSMLCMELFWRNTNGHSTSSSSSSSSSLSSSPSPCGGPGGYIGDQGSAPLWGSRGLHWQSRVSTPVGVQGAALAKLVSSDVKGPKWCQRTIMMSYDLSDAMSPK